jgi:hypothetical protein
MNVDDVPKSMQNNVYSRKRYGVRRKEDVMGASAEEFHTIQRKDEQTIVDPSVGEGPK